MNILRKSIRFFINLIFCSTLIHYHHWKNTIGTGILHWNESYSKTTLHTHHVLEISRNFRLLEVFHFFQTSGVNTSSSVLVMVFQSITNSHYYCTIQLKEVLTSTSRICLRHPQMPIHSHWKSTGICKFKCIAWLSGQFQVNKIIKTCWLENKSRYYESKWKYLL